MEDELIHTLKDNKIFSSLDEFIIQKIAQKFIKIELGSHEALFYQGNPSDSIYLLGSGKLVAALATSTGETKMIGYIEPGEIIGEAGVLTGEPRTITVKTVHECILYRLLSTDFIELCHQHPKIMFAIIPPLMTRTNELLHFVSTEKMNRHIVITPANKAISLEKFAEKLQ